MEIITKGAVTQFIKRHKQEFLEKYGVSKIGLFGSVARDEVSTISDIDIVIDMLPEKKTLHNFLEFKRTLEEAFGRTVDIGIETALKPAVKRSIQQEIIYV